MNKFKKIRDKYELNGEKPSRMREAKVVDFSFLEQLVEAEDEVAFEEFFQTLWMGDVYIVKNAFSEEWVAELKKKTLELFRQTQSTFHKMKEGVPDFHRVIDETVSANYSISAIKHAAYFFPWNKESHQLFTDVYRRWRVFKCLGGFDPDEYVGNTPKDEIVDRIQVCVYPKGKGSLGSHSDPFHNQRYFISGFLSSRGKSGADYSEGGFYTVNQQGSHVDLEPMIQIGDMGFGYATVHHGVKLVDPNINLDYEPTNPNGRWFLGLYSNDSDEKKDRVTAYKVDS